MLRAFRGMATEVIVTEKASPRRMRAEELARHATAVLEPDGVTVEPDLMRAVPAAVERGAGMPTRPC